MSNTSYLVFAALVVVSVLYGIENRWPLEPNGLSAASKLVTKGGFAVGRWPLGMAFLGFALVVSRWRKVRLSRDDHV
jgi:hypothetical protein